MDKDSKDAVFYQLALKYNWLECKKEKMDFLLELEEIILPKLSIKSMHRKSLIRRLRASLVQDFERKKFGRRAKYNDFHKHHLVQIWKLSGYPCSKRLKALLGEWLVVYDCADAIKACLREISATQMDDYLRQPRIDLSTVANYFEILSDTLIGFQLPAFSTSVRKAQRLGLKNYFIDPGIKRALDGTLSVPLLPKSFAFGDAFEHWVILEFVKNISILRLDWKLSYLRTKDDLEIDLIVERAGLSTLLIEIKSTSTVFDEHVKALELLSPDIASTTHKKIEKYLLSLDELPKLIQSTQALHWIDGLKKIFG